MPETLSFTLPTKSGRTLHGLIDLPEQPGPRPTVVDCHGFKGFMEWGFHPYLADLLAARGFTVVRFNFTSSGMRPGDELVTDEEAFANGTFHDDVGEIQAILGALVSGELGAGRIDPDRLGLLGHSRGGGISILTAAIQPWRGRLKALVTWAAVGTFDRIGEKEKEQWRRLGALPVINARTDQRLELALSVLEDVVARRQEYDLTAAAARLTAPWLLLHGADDETVPVAEAHSLAAAAGSTFEQHIIAGGNHTFGAQHPFVGPTPQLIEVMNRTQRWLRQHLAS
ncbi:MAG: prolyl oligopeptidase family serine peptidase [Acidobacteria bacterium]|nr:prolyl oligopeptidase family serine peptidase [Acidobacteriota bacterium]